ncbi:MAG: HD-GYP domain-containing protein [Kiritimatiellia bacterium]
MHDRPPSGTTHTILIVDDDLRTHELLAALLSQDDYVVYTATGGLEALKLAARVMPDLILLDVMMPDMNGFDVCRQLRIDPLLRDTPVVLITSMNDSHVRLRGIEAGADDFVAKPFDPSELRARVRNITQLNRYRKLVTQRTEFQRLLAEVENACDLMMENWARALEQRGVESVGHSSRMAKLAMELARELQVPADEQVAIRRGAILHDIGKSVMSDEVLLKQEALNEEEQAIVRKQPLYAEELLGSIAFLRPALAIPLHHHERWDGSGYPHGTKGLDIPLPARLFAVVDVWDALCTHRPHRRAWPPQKACAYLRDQAGVLFDPAVVTAFMNVLSRVSPAGPELTTGIPETNLARTETSRPSPLALSVVHRGAWGHLALAATLITGLPFGILCWLWVNSGPGHDLPMAARWAAGLVAGSIILLGYAMLAKYPANIVRLRRYLRDLASDRIPVALILSTDEDDLTAIRRYMCDLVRQAEERVRTTEARQTIVLTAERQRVMIESLGAICHHLGQPATRIGACLYMMKNLPASPELQELITECQQAFEALTDIHARLQAITSYRTEAYLTTEAAHATQGSRILEV